MQNNSNSFEQLHISEPFLKAVHDMGFENPTDIQIKSIEIMNEGKDVIGQSQTGSGKTVAFGIPALESIDPTDRSVQCVVLCPTRELAIQVSTEFQKLLKYKEGVRVLPIYGGQPIGRQISALKGGVQVVVGTPGRVMDHMKRRTLRLETTKIIVLDEADEMLDMGFREDIETVLKQMPEDRQMMLYSATLSKEIMSLAQKYTHNPEIIRVKRSELMVSSITEFYYDIKERDKFVAVCRILDYVNPSLAVIFCNTKRRVDQLVTDLNMRGFRAEGLHGDLMQQQRDKVMDSFRYGKTKILVATDVAARGIDVDNVDFVLNYDLPLDNEYYVHRIGRTGRAGKEGVAYSFVVGKEIYRLRDIMRYTKSDIKKGTLPKNADIQQVRIQKFTEKVLKTAENIKEDIFQPVLSDLLETELSEQVLAYALLKLALKSEDIVLDSTKVDIEFVPQRFAESSRGSSSKGSDRRRDSRGKSSSYDDSNMVRLHINLGRIGKIEPKDVVGAIAGEAGIPGKSIGAIDIYDKYTFVDVPKEYSDTVISALNGGTIRGKDVDVSLAADSDDVPSGDRRSRSRTPSRRPSSRGSSSASRTGRPTRKSRFQS